MYIQISWLLTDLDLHCLSLNIWFSIKKPGKVIWLAGNQKCVWHLNLFSRARVDPYLGGDIKNFAYPENVSKLLSIPLMLIRPRDIKLFFMPNSAVNKAEVYNNFKIFFAKHSCMSMTISLLIIVGIFIFISRKRNHAQLNWACKHFIPSGPVFLFGGNSSTYCVRFVRTCLVSLVSAVLGGLCCLHKFTSTCFAYHAFALCRSACTILY